MSRYGRTNWDETILGEIVSIPRYKFGRDNFASSAPSNAPSGTWVALPVWSRREFERALGRGSLGSPIGQQIASFLSAQVLRHAHHAVLLHRSGVAHGGHFEGVPAPRTSSVDGELRVPLCQTAGRSRAGLVGLSVSALRVPDPDLE
jgi:hypothetical protein